MTRNLERLLVTCLALAIPGAAAAEKVKTTERTAVMARPGEQARVLTNVSSGRRLEVVGRQGRWVKVRVNGTTGWVTRSSVESAGEEEGTLRARDSVRKTRKKPFVEGRLTRRGWSSGPPEDRVGGDALDEEELDDEASDDGEEVAEEKPRKAPRKPRPTRVARRDDGDDEEDDLEDDDGDDAGDEAEPAAPTVTVTAGAAKAFRRPSASSGTKFTAQQGDRLRVIRWSKKRNWVLVEDEGGDAGWMRAGQVRDGAGYPYPRLAYRGAGRLGYSTFGQNFLSDGQGDLANYQIASAAATVSVGAEVLYTGYSPTTILGGDLTYRGSRSSPGIRYVAPDGAAADIAFTTHEVDLGARVGYRTRGDSGLALYARLGYHYGNFAVKEVDDLTVNLARIPSETLKGVTSGVLVDVPRVKEKIAAQAGLDVLYPGTRVQTAGLEDGASSKVLAAWATARLSYQLKPDLAFEASYRYFWSKTEWVGQAMGSMRMHNATAAARADTMHSVLVGLGKTF